MGEARRRKLAVESTGLKIDVGQSKSRRPIDDPGGDTHLWMVFSVHKVNDPSADRFELDTENLVSIEGPGCFKCEQPYTPRLEKLPCKGSVK